MADEFDKVDDVLFSLTDEMIESELIKHYSLALKRIKGVMREIYDRFGDSRDALTYAEMKKYQRWRGMELAIQEILVELTDKKAETLTNGLGELYTEAYFRTAFIVERAVQMGLGFALINRDTIRAAVQMPVDKLTLNDRLKAGRVGIIQRIRHEITQGLILGESYDNMADRFVDVLEGDKLKAIRIAQTEGHRVQNLGRMNCLRYAADQGVDMEKVWVSTLDNLTRHTHRDLDGQKVPLDGVFTINGHSADCPGQFGVAEEDINCRCTVRAQIKGMDDPTRRLARDGKNRLIPYQTYNQWIKALGREPKEATYITTARERKKEREKKRAEREKEKKQRMMERTRRLSNKDFKAAINRRSGHRNVSPDFGMGQRVSSIFNQYLNK